MFQTINPTTEEILQNYSIMSAAAIDNILSLSNDAYQEWKNSAFTTRKSCMLKLSDVLLAHKADLANLITDEMGKPITQAIAEIEKCARVCRFYAENAETYLASRIVKTDYQKALVCYEPLGVVFAIMPWNFPIWQVIRFLAPNLMAGNAAILRHADCTTGCGLLLEKLVREAGFPKNIFRVIIITHDMAPNIIADPRIVGVTLTGSERAGRSVASEAGKALKKVVLEMGGSDPYVVLEDADLELAADTCIKSRLNNTGQVCIAAKRFIVVDAIYDAFKNLILQKTKSYVAKDPHNPDCQLGPLARKDLRETLHKQVQACVDQGCTLLVGGHIPAGKGFYYPVTILENVTPSMPAYNDELFGPVITLMRARNEQEALHIANDVRFGLGAAVFTRDLKKGEHIARDILQAGTCAINTLVTTDPRLPFGGTKSSGFGRELSIEGIHEFTNIKTVYCK